MKEKILDAFKQLGFSLIKTDEMGYGFSCERTIACCHLFEKWPFRQKYGTSSFFKEISRYDYK